MTDVGKLTGRAFRAGCAATCAAVLGAAPEPATSLADPATGHQVTYTVTATGNLTGNVRYMSSDPPSQAAYDSDSSQYMTSVQAALAAGQPQVYTTTLTNPIVWAIVSASGGCHWPDCDSGNVPQIQCQIAVDGEVVVTQSATTGVTCSTRRW
ncbi:MAG: hypothetical protein WCI78_03235 [Mycobacterium sp.]